jgi:Trypsin-like peptidase domain
MKALVGAAFIALSLSAAAQEGLPAPDSKAIYEHTKAASVLILSGDEAGRVNSIAIGVILSRDGVIFAPLHAVKGAAAVQIRLANGEIFDRVDLLGSDERRDVAALKISAGALPALTTGGSATLALGAPVFAVTNSSGLTWSATEGILYAISSAEEIPGAGTGFNLLRFTATVAPGASGGALVDHNGALIGIITGPKSAASPFAVPIENVLGLPEAGPRTAFGSGASLQIIAQQTETVPRPVAAVANTDPKQIIKNAKTVYVHSKTMFITVEAMVQALTQQKEWPDLGLTIVQDPSAADLLIEVSRIKFTNVHTFVLSDKKTSIVLNSHNEIAINGAIASRSLAKDIVAIFSAARLTAPTKQP